jgi:flagellar hook-basal body complex protein FliE
MTTNFIYTPFQPATGLELALDNLKHISNTDLNSEALTDGFTAALKALDGVSAEQQTVADLTQMAITDPSSVDAHDLTIAQAQAQMSLNIARTVLNRLVDGWQELINTQ